MKRVIVLKKRLKTVNLSMLQVGKVVLDTSVVVRHFRQQTSLDTVLVEASEIFLPSIVLGELFYGAFNAGKQWREETLNQVRTFSSMMTIAYPDEDTAEVYARSRLELKEKGKPIPDNDIWIAAIALQRGLPLYANDDHFEQLEALNYVKT